MTDKIARVWNGSEWVVVSSPVGVPNSIAVYQQEPPLSPAAGQLWVDSDSADDGNYFISSTMDLGLLVVDINNIQSQIDLKSPINSPTFTGVPAGPTAVAGTSTTQLATTGFVTTADNLKANLASPTFTGTLSAADVTLSGILTVAETTEILSTGTISSNIFTANFNNGATFYITTAPSANFTINVTNLPTTDNRVTVLSFFVLQGATGYIPNALQIGGSAQTIKWSNGTTPTATNGAGKVDVFTFTFIRRSSTWEVLGTSDTNY